MLYFFYFLRTEISLCIIIVIFLFCNVIFETEPYVIQKSWPTQQKKRYKILQKKERAKADLLRILKKMQEKKNGIFSLLFFFSCCCCYSLFLSVYCFHCCWMVVQMFVINSNRYVIMLVVPLPQPSPTQSSQIYCPPTMHASLPHITL